MTSSPFIVATPSRGADGAVKGVSINNLPEEAWTVLSSIAGGTVSPEIYRKVWVVYRGVTIRAATLATVPFEVKRGKTVVDSSQDWQNVIGYIPSPKRFLKRCETALTLWSQAYFEKGENRWGIKKALFYVNPASISPRLADDGSVELFIRKNKSGSQEVDPATMVYFWEDDPFVEAGVPQSSPYIAALESAGVIRSGDQTITKFFNNGMIKGTLLAIKGNPPEAEKERIKSLWQRIFGGGKKTAWGEMVVNSDSVAAVPIGEGLDALDDGKLFGDRANAVATALGIPHSMLFSNAANYATATEDKMTFYESTIIPECDLIEEVLNTQVFEPAGLSFRFLPENLDVFQEDESQRAASLNTFMDVLAKAMDTLPDAEAAIAILEEGGYELSEATQNAIRAMYQRKEENRAAMAEVMKPKEETTPPAAVEDEPPDEDDAQEEDLRKWQRKAVKRLKAGGSAACTFESPRIPLALRGAIEGQLECVKTEQDLALVFQSAWRGYP